MLRIDQQTRDACKQLVKQHYDGELQLSDFDRLTLERVQQLHRINSDKDYENVMHAKRIIAQL